MRATTYGLFSTYTSFGRGSGKRSANAFAAQGMAPTCTGIWSACATSRHCAIDQRDGEIPRRIRICE